MNSEHHAPATGWTNRDAIAARDAGWGVYDCAGSERGPYRLCKCDDMEAFNTDDALWSYLAAKAREGNPLALKALGFVAKHSPAERDAFRAAEGF